MISPCRYYRCTDRSLITADLCKESELAHQNAAKKSAVSCSFRQAVYLRKRTPFCRSPGHRLSRIRRVTTVGARVGPSSRPISAQEASQELRRGPLKSPGDPLSFRRRTFRKFAFPVVRSGPAGPVRGHFPAPQAPAARALHRDTGGTPRICSEKGRKCGQKNRREILYPAMTLLSVCSPSFCL